MSVGIEVCPGLWFYLHDMEGLPQDGQRLVAHLEHIAFRSLSLWSERSVDEMLVGFKDWLLDYFAKAIVKEGKLPEQLNINCNIKSEQAEILVKGRIGHLYASIKKAS